MGKPDDEGRRLLASDLAEIRRFAGPNPDVDYMAGLLLENFRAGRYDRRTASPVAPANPDPLRSLTPEELAAFKPISNEQIDEALMKGARARWQAEHPAVSTAGVASTPPSEPCPNCESTTGCDCSPDDVLGAIVETDASVTTEGPQGETKP